MANLRPPNRKNTKRTKTRAVERFEREVDEFVKNLLTTEYDHEYKRKKGKVQFNSLRIKYIYTKFIDKYIL